MPQVNPSELALLQSIRFFQIGIFSIFGGESFLIK
jgi:hypothetical protein